MATDVIERAGRLIEAATGDRYGDGDRVTDVVVGYAEPGYGSTDDVIVFGNWNPKRWPRDGEPPLTKDENVGPRLARALEFVGCDLQWSDEWTTCGECHRAMRTEPDSYSWTVYGAFIEDACDFYCADCLRDDLATSLEAYVNDPSRAVTWASSGDLTAAGWVQWEADDPHQYESGWHPGQTDDPTEVLAAIHESDPATEVVFLIDSVGQFDCHWSAYVKGEA